MSRGHRDRRQHCQDQSPSLPLGCFSANHLLPRTLPPYGQWDSPSEPRSLPRTHTPLASSLEHSNYQQLSLISEAQELSNELLWSFVSTSFRKGWFKWSGLVQGGHKGYQSTVFSDKLQESGKSKKYFHRVKGWGVDQLCLESTHKRMLLL